MTPTEEKQFDETFDLFATDWTVPPTVTKEVLTHIKSFISQLLSTRTEEIVKELEGMRDGVLNNDRRNHYKDGTCAKCEKHDPPICHNCGIQMTNAKDPKTKKISKYLWQCEKCFPHLILSIG